MDLTHGRKLIGCVTELGFSQEEEKHNINRWKLNNHLTAINKGFPKNLANVFILLISPKYAVQLKEVDFEMPLSFRLKY